MRILFLSRWFPEPPNNGAKIRVFNLIKGLSEQHTVDLLTFYEADDSVKEAVELRKLCAGVATVPYRAFQPGSLKATLGYLSPKPRSVVDTYQEDMARAVRKAVARRKYDLVIASQIDMAIYAAGVRGPKKVLEELEITKILRKSEVSGSWLKRARGSFTWWKLANYISWLMKQYDGWTVVSEGERKAAILAAPGSAGAPALVPNGVDCAAFQPEPDEDVDENALLFHGAISYRPNFEAVEYFMREIFPLIRAERPQTRLYVTGKADAALQKRLAGLEGVTFTGYLQDIRPVLAACAVSVVPLLTGGGTRLKILEALAAGKAVVSTMAGAEGLEVKDGRDLLIADRPADFAQATLRLLNDADLRARLGRQGRTAVSARYDWRLINVKFNQYLEGIVTGQPQSAEAAA